MGFKTKKDGTVYNDDKKEHGQSGSSPGNNDGSEEPVRDYFNSLNSFQQFNMENNAGVEQEDQIYNGEDKHNFDDNLESTQKKLKTYFSKFNKETIDVAVKSEYPNDITIDDFDDLFGDHILQYVDEEKHSDEPDGSFEFIHEDPKVRLQHVKDYAEKHNAQIYTYVDLDSGDTGYSKGIRFANRINQGEYVVVNMHGLKVDNS
jgi:hypothetical protein